MMKDNIKEIVKVLEATIDGTLKNPNKTVTHRGIIHNETYTLEDIAKSISAIPCSNCKELKKYSKEVIDELSMENIKLKAKCKRLEDLLGKAAECRDFVCERNKELKAELVNIINDRTRDIEYYHEENTKLKTHIKEQTKISDNHVDEIDKIPCKKCKELEKQVIATVKGFNKVCEERVKLKTHIEQQNKINDNHVDEIDKRGREIEKKQKLLGEYAGYIDNYRRNEKDINEERDNLKAEVGRLKVEKPIIDFCMACMCENNTGHEGKNNHRCKLKLIDIDKHAQCGRYMEKD